MNHFKRLTIKAAALLISAGLVFGNCSVAAMAAPAEVSETEEVQN